MSRFLRILALICAAFGFFSFLDTGMRFSALLLWCAAAFCGMMALLSRFAETRLWARRCRSMLLSLFCVGVVCFLVLEGLVLSGAKSGADDVPDDISCIIVLGAGVNGEEPSMILSSRLSMAVQLAQDHPDVPIIVTGSQGRGEDISEATCMYRELTWARVERERIWKEEQATSTRTNFRYSYALMREHGLDMSEPFAFVTSDFHVYRAKKLAGTDAAYGVAAHLPDSTYFSILTLNYKVREAFALANEYLFRMDLDV